MVDRVEGTVREFGGRVQEAVGDVTGDAKTQAQGLYNQAAGQAQQAASQLSDVVKAQPILSSLVALGVGYMIGRLTS
ncbi:CsbD family protein [Acidisphaera sp. S103]|uniref:CsbD family protein n=1 Tax=Acidisphaera sp. S103 TaxID=1747223 RepID=UPI00131CCE5F|nr:CsbD family protein [Acidisphaera sp. S103]